MNEDRLDLLFQALAHPARRRMLDLLMWAPGMTVSSMSGQFEVSRIAVMKHLKVLEEADLVLSRKKGRTRQLFFNPVPLQEIHDRWSDKYSAFWAERMVDVKERVEGRAAKKKGGRSA